MSGCAAPDLAQRCLRVEVSWSRDSVCLVHPRRRASTPLSPTGRTGARVRGPSLVTPARSLSHIRRHFVGAVRWVSVVRIVFVPLCVCAWHDSRGERGRRSGFVITRGNGHVDTGGIALRVNTIDMERDQSPVDIADSSRPCHAVSDRGHLQRTDHYPRIVCQLATLL